MKHFSRHGTDRKGRTLLTVAALLAAVGASFSVGAVKIAAQGAALRASMATPEPLMGTAAQSYLGVDLADVDAQKAQTLKLKEVRGAVITLIDHDAPAGLFGLRVNDVVLALNGTPVEGAEQLRRILRETPAGRKVSMLISRDGNQQTMAVELADRKTVEHEAWNRIDSGSDVFSSNQGMSLLGEGSGAGDAPTGSGFHLPFFGGSPNVGLLTEPLNAQMAEVLGVKNGLMVKHVARRSAAFAAGFRALDVILKVGSEPVTSVSSWDRVLRAYQGKTVQVTILRDRKQQTVTLDVSTKRHG